VTGDFGEKKNLMISYGNLVFVALPAISSTFMRTRRSKRENIMFEALLVIVFRDMTQCIPLDGVALAHQIH
jgi:hypothetical protein